MVDDTYDKQHLDGCRKNIYDPKSSPCTCRTEFERIATELAFLKRPYADADEPITEEWLKSVGFKWHQFDRQTSKHWLLWLGDAMNGGGFSSFEDIGVELAAGAYDFKRKDSTDWFCWLRGDSAHRYHRFIHVRHLRTRGEAMRLVEGLTGQRWNPEDHLYGSCRSPEQAERIRREDADRIDRRERWHQRPPWAEVEKDDTRGRALPEHMEVAEKARGGI